MASILLNDTTINTVGGPALIRSAETITDAGLIAALPAAGGVLWPANDLTVAAAAATVLKIRSKGGSEQLCTAVMLAAAINTMALGDTVVNLPVAAQTAGTDIAETPNGFVPTTQGGNVVAAVYIPISALTANNSNYLTITIFKRTAGGASVQLALVTTQITGSGNWTAWVPVPIPITAPAVAAGDVLTFTVTHTGTGVALPAGQLIINVN